MPKANHHVETYHDELGDYMSRKKAAVNLQTYIGKLLVEKSVELVLFRNQITDITISDILRLHNYGHKVVSTPINVFDSSALAKDIFDMNIAPAKIDIGKLASEWSTEKDNYASRTEFLNDKLNHCLIENSHPFEARDVVLFGFGRIGRLAARELIRQGVGQQLRLKAIVLRSVDDKSIKKRAALFENDSVHGRFKGSVEIDYENKCLLINGQRIHIIESKDASTIDYNSYGIENALVIDNTGVYTTAEALKIHTDAKGVDMALLTAPGAGMPNIVYGINHKELDLENTTLYSAASCTTNAISPVLKVINDNFGVVKGHVETIHAYTNDQNLLDNMHKKPRRGRSAAINMVITSTGAGKAVAKVIPELAGKLTANAVRVPTPNGSLAILNLDIEKTTNLEEVLTTMKNAALKGNLVNQIYYSINEELVSNDIIGNDCCAVYDSPATLVAPSGNNIILYVWYDNEFGYTKQVIRLAKYIAKVGRNIYY
jgi:glyceraldehyde 3-phosphate dehydrogenase